MKKRRIQTVADMTPSDIADLLIRYTEQVERIKELETEVAQLDHVLGEMVQAASHDTKRIAELKTDLKIADDMGHELDDQLHYAKAKLAAVGELERFDVDYDACEGMYRVPAALGDFVDADDLEALLKGDE